jgi:hypothetical protein
MLFCLSVAGVAVPAQQVGETHVRIEQTEVPGRRIELNSLKGAVLFVAPEAETQERLPLIIHFHGAPWLMQFHIAKVLPRAALITVQLGSGSSVYGRPFADTPLFKTLLDEARSHLQLKHEWSSITLTGFSAGYGAIRAILRNDDYAARIDNVLLLDGIHASYSPEGTPPMIKGSDLDSFVEFARLAVAGKKKFVIAHSAIFPAAYASTTECTNFVIAALGLDRRLAYARTRTGMQQMSFVDARGFRVRGYAGSTAPDHVDFLHSTPEWLSFFGI